MSRIIYALVALFVVSTTLGCAMRAAPFDYTGPVPADGMSFTDRAGSILTGNGMSETMFEGEVSQEAVGPTPAGEEITPMQDQIMQGDMPGEPTYAPSPTYGPASRPAPSRYWR